MPQTLLVVASVIVLSLFGLNRHRAELADERAGIGLEIEGAALAVGERWTGIARDLAFDEADVGSAQIRLAGNVTGLSATLGREAGESLADLTTLDDVDDLNGLGTTETTAAGSGVVSFTVTARAKYAVPRTWADSPSNAPTTAKIVEVVVTEVTTGTTGTTGVTGRPPVRVTLPVRLSAPLQYTRAR